MTKSEILSMLPDIIMHPAHGYAELEILSDKRDDKGLCYRHKNNSTSYGTYGKSWQIIFDDLGPSLVDDGFKVVGLNS